MKRGFLYLLSMILLVVASPGAQAENDYLQWQMFGGNPQHTNYSGLEFFTSHLKRLWTFSLDEHIFRYARRISVWSSSAVSAKIGQDTFIFIGSYTHHLYCINARDGKEAWRFTTGAAINSAPLFTWVKDKPLVIVASTDRIIYCLDAKSGEKLWNYPIYPWTFTVFEAVSSSPFVVEIEGLQCVVFAVWYADRRPLRNLQQGEVLCLDALTGKKIWGRPLSSSFLFSPAFVRINGNPLIFITSSDGNIYCLSAWDGNLIWKFTSSIPVTSSPLLARLEDKSVVLFGTFFGLIFCLNAENGELLWKYKVRMQVSSIGAAAKIGKRDLVFVSSYDRSLYALDLLTGQCLWSYPTKQHISASPIIVKMEGKARVIFPSLDNKIYALDAETGEPLWTYPLGRRLWAYETRGETLWPSPIAVSSNDKSLLIVPWYDGKVYAFAE
ncbi:MAG: hypothetical protein A3J51_06660 [Omnitrophica WOR_2 bacterium RIFCSPHIGHO2_02_FULL_45_21]|nr:MAG: hypothetical protein A3J51_06660 [Omnitrophica WOR_2 bacterium RIFCSPHIGHO2_02_FULL_45_21]